jgi:hypothetical protein
MRQSLPNAEPAPLFRRPRADLCARVSRDADFASVLKSDEAIVVQHTRRDSRRSEVSVPKRA